MAHQVHRASHLPSLVPVERIQGSIILIRGRKVMLDEDLAHLYCVETKALNRAVKRNRERFPKDFMFQLTSSEYETLRYQFGTSKIRAVSSGRGGRRYLPYVFTEHGAVMLASVLNSHVAVEASIQVVRAFIRLRKMLASNKLMAKKLRQLEKLFNVHDRAITNLSASLRWIIDGGRRRRPRIGFRPA